MSAITIFHTNDFHNKLTIEKASHLHDLKSSTSGSILLDCGDAIWSGNIFFRPGGEPILKLMNSAGYDAMTLGNREFHFLQTGLRKKIGWAEFPVLCANIKPSNGADLPVRSDITIERDGIRVAIFGLTVPMITQRMLSRRVSAYVFDDPLETARRILPRLRERADIVIALTHIGLNKDRELAASVPGIDLVIGGHTHAVLENPETVEKTTIVQAGWYAHKVGKVEIEPGGEVRASLLEL
jgi:2',3'-cyclic-nucleotide 2'-phosphodiesterase (5'-nucleotidase family)